MMVHRPPTGFRCCQFGRLIADDDGKRVPTDGRMPDEVGIPEELGDPDDETLCEEQVFRTRDASSCSAGTIQSPYFALTFTTLVT